MSVNKEKDLKYIKDFSKISVSSVCKEVGVDRQNLLNGRASEKSTEAVKNKIKEKIKELDDEIMKHIPRID